MYVCKCQELFRPMLMLMIRMEYAPALMSVKCPQRVTPALFLSRDVLLLPFLLAAQPYILSDIPDAGVSMSSKCVSRLDQSGSLARVYGFEKFLVTPWPCQPPPPPLLW